MAVIDPQGLFYGERLAACSDIAQLYWPRLFLAANGLARMELSYSQIVSECFRNFRKSPKDYELWEIIAEYERNFLAVTYEADGSWWVQFITSERLLPRHKTKKDLRTPAPPAELTEACEKGYLEWKRAKGFGYQRFQKSAENSAKFPIGVGVGEGVGVGKGAGEGEKQQTLAQLALTPTVVPALTPAPDPIEAIYSAYPRKVGKAAALKAIRKALSSMQVAGRTEREAQEYLYRRTQTYARSPAGQNGEYTPHPATWFNRGSFDDDEQEWQRAGDTGNGRKTFGQLKHDSILGNVTRALGHEPIATGSDHRRVGLSGGGPR